MQITAFAIYIENIRINNEFPSGFSGQEVLKNLLKDIPYINVISLSMPILPGGLNKYLISCSSSSDLNKIIEILKKEDKKTGRKKRNDCNKICA